MSAYRLGDAPGECQPTVGVGGRAPHDEVYASSAEADGREREAVGLARLEAEEPGHVDIEIISKGANHVSAGDGVQL
jgi:hypothetical protein